MIYSMTGYAAAARELDYGSISLELRTVNHRYLEIQFRLPEELRAAEGALREAIGKRIGRGKVDCRANFAARPGAASLHVDAALVERLAGLNGEVKARLPAARDLSVAEILAWPGVMAQAAVSAEALHEAAIEVLGKVLEELDASRAREGEKLKAILLDRAERIGARVREAAPLLPVVLAAYQEKLQNALREVGANPDDDRLRQDITLFAQRIDVDEELSRLQAHLTEVRRVLDGGGAVGKRLDFLMQELNREANTLGAKSFSTALTRIAMELKVLIEQMREQIQNLE